MNAEIDAVRKSAADALEKLMDAIDSLHAIASGKVSAMPSISEVRKIEIIQGKFADFFQIPVEHLRSHDRRERIALARQCSMVLAYDHTKLSLQEIGDFFGGFDHGTVMHARKTVSNRMDTSPDFKTSFEKIRCECLAEFISTIIKEQPCQP